jgi:hypothetical protein
MPVGGRVRAGTVHVPKPSLAFEAPSGLQWLQGAILADEGLRLLRYCARPPSRWSGCVKSTPTIWSMKASNQVLAAASA